MNLQHPCAVTKRNPDIGGKTCGILFCSLCMQERYPVLKSGSHLNQIAYLVCHPHFCHFVRCHNKVKEKFTIKYESELNIFHALGDKTIIDPPTMSRTEDMMEKMTEPFYNTNQEPVASYANERIPLVKASVRKDETSKGK